MTDLWFTARQRLHVLGATVLQARLDADMTQSQLVQHIDPLGQLRAWNVPVLSRIEAGYWAPDAQTAEALTTWLSAQQAKVILDSTTPATRAHDPHTSHDAAKTVKPTKIRELHVWWLHHLEFVWRDPNQIGQLNFNGDPRGYFATDEGARKFYDGKKVSESGFRTRRAELKHAGLVEDSGLQFEISTGNQAVAWRLTAAGQQLAKETPQP